VILDDLARLASRLPPSIFIVEDEVVVAKDIEQTLIELGYRVVGRAINGATALVEATQLKPDLILMDIGLAGGIDGVATAAAIREQTSIPVVFLSGLIDPATLDRAGATDSFGYLVKPFTPSVLRAAIEIAMRRSRAEVSAHAREQLLATTLQAIGDGVITTNEQGRISFLNPVAERLTGWSSTEAMGQRLDEVLPLRDEGTGERAAFSQPGVVDGVTRSSKGTLLVGRTRTVAIESSSAPVLDAQAQVLGAVIVFRDTSEQQQLRGQIRGYQKMEIVGQMTSEIAHDFNNVLSAILMCSRFLVGSFDEEDPRRQELEEIERSGNRGVALTRQLLTFGRRQTLDAAPLNLNEVVTELGQMLRVLAGQVELRFEAAPDLGLVVVDRGQMERVLVNLTVNARDAMPAGGTLQFTTTNLTLDQAGLPELHHLRPGRYVVLSVTDNGCGMNAETQLHAFEPFFSTKEPNSGSGLGLSASHEIVRAAGGEIVLSSELGRGTTFTVYFPRSEGRTNSYTRELSARVDSAELETILLIEKELSAREHAARTLEACGYRVLRAADLVEATALADSFGEHIHLLLSDVLISGADGTHEPSQLELLCVGAQQLLMSSYADDPAQRAGANALSPNVIRKPFVSDELARKVRTVLDSGTTLGRPLDSTAVR